LVFLYFLSIGKEENWYIERYPHSISKADISR